MIKALKYVVKKLLSSLQNKQTYCLGCKKHANNIGSKVIMTDKVIRDKSGCVSCVADKSRFSKEKHNKKVVEIILIININWHFV